ncbi:hypothetical protein DXU03_26020 [Rhizobium johnstonii]
MLQRGNRIHAQCGIGNRSWLDPIFGYEVISGRFRCAPCRRAIDAKDFRSLHRGVVGHYISHQVDYGFSLLQRFPQPVTFLYEGGVEISANIFRRIIPDVVLAPLTAVVFVGAGGWFKIDSFVVAH